MMRQTLCLLYLNIMMSYHVAKCYLFVKYNKKVDFLPVNEFKIIFVVWQKDFRMSVDVIKICREQSTPLGTDNSIRSP